MATWQYLHPRAEDDEMPEIRKPFTPGPMLVAMHERRNQVCPETKNQKPETLSGYDVPSIAGDIIPLLNRHHQSLES